MTKDHNTKHLLNGKKDHKERKEKSFTALVVNVGFGYYGAQ